MMQDEEYVAASAAVPAGTVIGHDKYAVGSNGEHFAVSRRCRHLGADLAEGHIDSEGCLVCPWHGAAYDVDSGRMVRGPGGVFAKVPGLGVMFKTLTRVTPLERRQVIERAGDLYLKKGPIA